MSSSCLPARRNELASRDREREGGQILVTVMLLLPVMIGFLVLTIDGGNALAQRRRMQNAADAAALAGARALALGRTYYQIDTEIAHYAKANGADEYKWKLLRTKKGVRVAASVRFHTVFGALLGVESFTAKAEAEATLHQQGVAYNLLPILVYQPPGTRLSPGQSICLLHKPSSCKGRKRHAKGGGMFDRSRRVPLPPGLGICRASRSFVWADWNGPPSSAHELALNIAHPQNSGTQKVGGWVFEAPGAKVSYQVRRMLNRWVRRHVTVPLFDTYRGCGSRARYRVVGFAELELGGYVFKGPKQMMWGRVVRWVEPAPGPGEGTNLSVQLSR
ncbi:MAG TPA: hypothetical protein EYP04_05970 [Anaerolineae bacterium]|nr:hypothetical protein [Anaerolineae bacterium]HIQ06784.1 hypothetical protein [Anaerolineae bacterium]